MKILEYNLHAFSLGTMNQSKKIIETRRRFQRVIFSREDGIIGLIQSSLQNQRQPAAASILNLSASGLQFTAGKEDAGNYKKGDRLIFKGIKGVKDLDFQEDIEMEVVWVLELKFLENIGIGCEFLNISKALTDHINDFVMSEVRFRGQNIYRNTV